MNMKDGLERQDNSMDINFCMVIYNNTIDNCQAFQSIKESLLTDKDIHTIICDNSTHEDIKNINLEQSKAYDFTYLDMQGNRGLSNAYNRAIDHCQSQWIITSDQDTTYPHDYFQQIQYAIQQHPDISIFYPYVAAHKMTMSPFKPYKSYPEMCAINSGACYKLDVFNTIHYNQTLFLDFVDIDLSFQIHQQHIPCMYLSDLILLQSFSGIEHTSKQNALIRYKIYLKDYRNLKRGWPQYCSIKKVNAFRHTIALTLKYKSLAFLKLYYK